MKTYVKVGEKHILAYDSEAVMDAKEAVIKALEDVRAKIEKSIKESVEKTSFNGSVFRCGLHEAVEIIDRKIAEVKKNG